MIANIADWVSLATRDYADRIALICDDGLEITYKELINQSLSLAKSLRASGIRAGDHIAFSLPNSPDWVRFEIACGMLGAVLVALNPRYGSHELTYMIKQSDSKMFILDRISENNEETLRELMPELFEDEKANHFTKFPSLKKVVFIEDSDLKGAWSLKDLLKNGHESHFEIHCNETSPFNMLFTSGTTSHPKGAVLNQNTILCHSFNIAKQMKITKDDVSLNALPFCGIFGLNSLWQSLVTGASVVIVDRFDIEKICKKIEKYRCTVWNAVDQMYMKLIEYRQSNSVNLDSLRIGAAGMFIYDGFEIIKKIERGLNYRILHTYGMSEVGSMLLLKEVGSDQEERAVSGGKPTSGKIKIIDPETLQELPNGQVGEMIISGINVMSGYYKLPELNQSVFIDNRFFRTGDLGKKLDDGEVEFCGRLKEAMRLSSFLVSPTEIENFLTEIKGIELAQVVGVEIDYKTIVAAFVKMDKKNALTVQDIKKECETLAKFKRPTYIFVVNNFPKSYGSNGEKIRRDVLVRMAKESILRNSD